jgi:hypothetical protein
MLLTCSMIARPKVASPARLSSSVRSGTVTTIPPAMAADTNTMARKSSPLPMKTDEKSWSSVSLKRSRTTPMNHRKAMPAKGTRDNPIVRRVAAPLWSQSADDES